VVPRHGRALVFLRGEERYCSGTFGETYAADRRRTGVFLPLGWVVPWKRGDSGRGEMG
jgi:hypothetical protein